MPPVIVIGITAVIWVAFIVTLSCVVLGKQWGDKFNKKDNI